MVPRVMARCRLGLRIGVGKHGAALVPRVSVNIYDQNCDKLQPLRLWPVGATERDKLGERITAGGGAAQRVQPRPVARKPESAREADRADGDGEIVLSVPPADGKAEVVACCCEQRENLTLVKALHELLARDLLGAELRLVIRPLLDNVLALGRVASWQHRAAVGFAHLAQDVARVVVGG
eukprot:scaffold325156_cov57-Tisochrysis_lutea.AAC.3